MKILVEAFLDKNFGDDLMVQMLADELKDHDIYLICNNDVLATPFQESSNIHLCEIKRGLSRLHDIKQFDAFIRIGGSIFQVRNRRELIYRFLSLPTLILLKMLRVKIMIIGCNLGPFSVPLAETVVKWDLHNASLVTVRDMDSYNLLSNCANHKTLYFPDIVLGYNLDTKELSENRECLGISVYRSKSNGSLNNIEYKQMALIINEYIRRTGSKVLLFALDSENENDIAAAFNILDRVERKELIEVIVHVSDPKKVIAEFSRCRSLIAIRFHSAIMAMKLNIPFLPVIYSNKMENLLNDIGYTGRRLYLDNLSSIDIPETVEALIDTKEIVNHVDPEIFSRARGHLIAARDMLEGEGLLTNRYINF